VLKMGGSVLRIFNLTTVVFRLWMDGETSRASEISTVLFDWFVLSDAWGGCDVCACRLTTPSAPASWASDGSGSNGSLAKDKDWNADDATAAEYEEEAESYWV
jgi:hypothetical protein